MTGRPFLQRRRTPALAAALLSCLLVTGCGVAPGAKETARRVEGPVFHETENPKKLSEWGLFSVGKSLTLSDGVVPYDLNTPLFTDYAHKLRTVWIPGGAPAGYAPGVALDFPEGTVISKTFYYPKAEHGPGFDGRVLKSDFESGRIGSHLSDLSGVRLVETRLLVRRAAGWNAISYVWDDDQRDATLTRIGDAQRLTLVARSEDGGVSETPFTYIVPDVNQCAGCHAPNNTTREISPIGPKPRHLNRDFAYADGTANQLAYWRDAGLLSFDGAIETAPRNADWSDETASLDARAVAYLDANCSHCHNPVGPADTSGLMLTPDAPAGTARGLCKLPVAAGSGTGGRRFDIVPGAPDQSILLFRMESAKSDEMMPELGRSLIHEEGVALIRAWIEAMEGDCS